MSHLADLIQQRGEIANSIRAVADKKDNWTAADLAQWERLNAAYDTVTDNIKIEKGQNMGDRTFVGKDGGKLGDGRGFVGNDGASVIDKGLAGWIRNQSGIPIGQAEVEDCNNCGISALSGTFEVKLQPHRPTQGLALRNSLAGQDGTAGGYLSGKSFVTSLEKALLDYSGVLLAATIMRTETGEDLHWPINNDTGNTGYQIGENVQVTDATDPTFGQIVFNSYMACSGLIRVPYTLLRDAAINLSSELGLMLGERIGRFLNTRLTTGTGAATAKGIVTCATLGVTAGSATAITFDEIIGLVHSVDPAYRSLSMGCGFMMHDTVQLSIRKLKDGDGNYIWQPSVTAGQPSTLLGYPVYTNQDMASSVATGNTTMLFGALSKYKVRLVGSVRIRRLVERYADYDQEGFLGFQGFDGNMLDAGTHPVKYLIQA